MEDDVRPVAGEDLGDARLVLRVADRRDDLDRRAPVAELLLDACRARTPTARTAPCARGAKRAICAAQLGADRAAGAGDQHRLAAEEALQPGLVELHRVAAEQVVELDRPQRRDADPARRRCRTAPARSSPRACACVHRSTARLRSPCVAAGMAMIACATPKRCACGGDAAIGAQHLARRRLGRPACRDRRRARRPRAIARWRSASSRGAARRRSCAEHQHRAIRN